MFAHVLLEHWQETLKECRIHHLLYVVNLLSVLGEAKKDSVLIHPFVVVSERRVCFRGCVDDSLAFDGIVNDVVYIQLCGL
jgi:hypothetical protein